MKTLLIIFFILCSFLTNGATYVSIVDGNWGTTTSWDITAVPNSNQTTTGDDITINSTITLSGDLNIKTGTSITINTGDTLIINGDLILNNGCVLLVNGVLIINGDVTNNNSSDDIIINGEIIIDGDFTGGTGSELGGTGSMDITGSVTTGGSGTVFGSDEDCDTLCDNSAASPILPIELESFQGYNKDNVNHIEWITVTEINNDFFTLERSRDSQIWKNLVNIQGAGNSNILNRYSYIDDSYDEGTNYYRLRQTDFNGQFEIFEIISITTPFVKYQDYVIINLLGQQIQLTYNAIRIILWEDGRRQLIPAGMPNPKITR